MQPNDLAESQKTEHCVSLGGLLNARHLVAVEASGPGYFPDATLASCFAHRCADLLGGHGLFDLAMIHLTAAEIFMACRCSLMAQIYGHTHGLTK